jgi:hypothetical protein
MKIKNIVFVSCSKDDKASLLEESIEKNVSKYTERFITKNNKESICKVYNTFIKENIDYYFEDTAIVFVHDDVYINCADLHDRLTEGLKEYDVIGLAGCVSAEIKPPGLWHLMSEKTNHRGAVAHPIGGSLTTYYITSFGPIPSRALLIDGVFIATTARVLKKVQFDESNPARFHYYDLDFSLECNKNKYKIGICDIPIIHMSPGLTKPDAEWQQGQDWFLQKWG